MSSLTKTEKLYLEKLLRMGSGYVLNYSDATYGEFFWSHGIDIHGPKYQTFGTSKARKMRSFWEQESDATVGKALSEMMDVCEAECDLNGGELDLSLMAKGRDIVGRLIGQKSRRAQPQTEDGFLREDFKVPNVGNLPIDPQVVTIINKRLEEVRSAFGACAYLSVIILCGSILEGVLLGAAQKTPSMFNQAKAAPKKNGVVSEFHKWTLAQFIDAASEIGLLKTDVKKFSHSLRDFRNYIHPYQELVSDFTPDQYTATLCFQVLKAALADVAGER